MRLEPVLFPSGTLSRFFQPSKARLSEGITVAHKGNNGGWEMAPRCKFDGSDETFLLPLAVFEGLKFRGNPQTAECFSTTMEVCPGGNVKRAPVLNSTLQMSGVRSGRFAQIHSKHCDLIVGKKKKKKRPHSEKMSLPFLLGPGFKHS